MHTVTFKTIDTRKQGRGMVEGKNKTNLKIKELTTYSTLGNYYIRV